MTKIRIAETMNPGQRHTSTGAGPQSTVVAPPRNDLSEQGRVWLQENRAAIDCYNEWIAEHGLPLEEFRQF